MELACGAPEVQPAQLPATVLATTAATKRLDGELVAIRALSQQPGGAVAAVGRADAPVQRGRGAQEAVSQACRRPRPAVRVGVRPRVQQGHVDPPTRRVPAPQLLSGAQVAPKPTRSRGRPSIALTPPRRTRRRRGSGFAGLARTPLRPALVQWPKDGGRGTRFTGPQALLDVLSQHPKSRAAALLAETCPRSPQARLNRARLQRAQRRQEPLRSRLTCTGLLPAAEPSAAGTLHCPGRRALAQAPQCRLPCAPQLVRQPLLLQSSLPRRAARASNQRPSVKSRRGTRLTCRLCGAGTDCRNTTRGRALPLPHHLLLGRPRWDLGFRGSTKAWVDQGVQNAVRK